MRRLVVAASFAAAGAAAYVAHAKELDLTIGELKSPAFSAEGLRARLTGPRLRELALDIARVTVAGRTYQKVRLSCPDAEVTSARVACAQGVADVGEKIPLRFVYLPARREIELEAKLGKDETWRLTGQLGSVPALELKIAGATFGRFKPWLPAALPNITQGLVNGTVTYRGNAVTAALDLSGLAFSDKSGLHAGEKINATVSADAQQEKDVWRWKTRVAWRAGEVFWQPFYVTAREQRMELEGVTTKNATEVRQGRLELPQLGSVAFTARWDHAAGALTALEAQGRDIRVPALYEQILKPLAQGTALADLRAEGELTVALELGAKGIVALDVDLKNVSFEDRRRRFAVFGLNGRVPWQRDGATKAELTLKGGEFLTMPIGAVKLPLRLRGFRVDVDELTVPVLDGALRLRNFAAASTESGWRWQFAGEVSPISMERLTQALGLPLMHGALAAVIPEFRYQRQVLSMDGELAMRVFDGTVRAQKLELIEPFGRAPRLHAELAVRGLDLELLTRTFDFGTITGHIDADVRDLELVAWEPVRFDARIMSSAGSYPRKISQRAVQNISALGGAGAAVAIQRSFLRFFDEFSYDRIGISCKLANGVCEMDGVEPAPQGYVIVKGGGVPALSVIGYNRHVNWRELIERLKRVTRENVKPVVK